MKFQVVFCGKNKKNIINLSSAEVAQGMVKVKAILELRWYSGRKHENALSLINPRPVHLYTAVLNISFG